ncbi:hypothetical protein P7K49_012301, partial [Saguinus oedipus]
RRLCRRGAAWRAGPGGGVGRGGSFANCLDWARRPTPGGRSLVGEWGGAAPSLTVRIGQDGV